MVKNVGEIFGSAFNPLFVWIAENYGAKTAIYLTGYILSAIYLMPAILVAFLIYHYSKKIVIKNAFDNSLEKYKSSKHKDNIELGIASVCLVITVFLVSLTLPNAISDRELLQKKMDLDCVRIQLSIDGGNILKTSQKFAEQINALNRQISLAKAEYGISDFNQLQKHREAYLLVQELARKTKNKMQLDAMIPGIKAGINETSFLMGQIDDELAMKNAVGEERLSSLLSQVDEIIKKHENQTQPQLSTNEPTLEELRITWESFKK